MKVPITEDELRIISLTNYFSKVFEQFVMDWLMEYVGDKMDWGQFGGLTGNSTSHYLIELVNFILYNKDLPFLEVVQKWILKTSFLPFFSVLYTSLQLTITQSIP